MEEAEGLFIGGLFFQKTNEFAKKSKYRNIPLTYWQNPVSEMEPDCEKEKCLERSISNESFPWELQASQN